MKKIKIATLSAITGIAITFTACGANNKSEAGGNAKTENATETTTKATVVSKMTGEFTLGETGDSSYKNTFYDVSFEAPDGWEIADTARRAKIDDITSEELTYDSVKAAIDSGKTRTLFFAEESSGNNNIMISANKRSDAKEVTAEKIIDSALPNLKATYEKQGYSDVNVTKESVKFKGLDTPAVKIVGKYNGKNVYHTQVLVVKGSYDGLITATSSEKDENQRILNLIKPAN